MVRLTHVMGGALVCSVGALACAVHDGYTTAQAAQQRLIALQASYHVVNVQERALPEREVVYGLDDDQNGTIDHIVLAQWTVNRGPTPTFRDYRLGDQGFNGFLDRLQHD